MRFAGTANQYSRKAMPQLTRTAPPERRRLELEVPIPGEGHEHVRGDEQGDRSDLRIHAEKPAGGERPFDPVCRRLATLPTASSAPSRAPRRGPWLPRNSRTDP